jgi:predicted dehydrogenase
MVVGHHPRFAPGQTRFVAEPAFDPERHTAFRQMADQIGTPFFVDAQYILAVDDPAAGWRGRSDLAGGGCLVDMGYHVIDLLLWYFGLPDRILLTPWPSTSVSATPC